MKTFCAKLNENNIVVKLIVISNNTTESWCSEKFGGVWIKCPSDTTVTLDYTYNPETQTFIPPVGEPNG